MRISNAEIQKVLAPHMNKVYSTSGRLNVISTNRPDQLTLSTGATEMQQIKQIASGLPEVRAGLVEGLRARIIAGDYRAKSQEIAESIVSDSVESKII